MQIFTNPKIVKVSQLGLEYANKGVLVTNPVRDPDNPADMIGELHSVCGDTQEELELHYAEAQRLDKIGIKHVICNIFDSN